ncbi:hypothetical protein [Actinophytocola algeriensis]|uniref:Uncharacterized protein n=1 Tax=Actinophytocola algeriensis TaxID=1768010 RepID=A0A7W7VCC2_9PSEU|nr:hypothetical protein [Actinophytocola algeriensis]MBB4905023.1 hypothetical protein [Actinophytocola algeriensis]MBE1476117.1 hypothetical protein [Actinophytocola algeriensis]
MTQTPVTEDQGTPIFDALAEEVGFEVVGGFDPNAEPDTTGDG